MIKLSNLLIISGTGGKSGKTAMSCRIIEQSRLQGVISIKISPHYHERNSGLLDFMAGEGYAVYRETDPDTEKDTSRMLKAGAAMVFLALVWDASLQQVFTGIMEKLPKDAPVICESPSLRNYIEPGMLIIMSSDNLDKRDDAIAFTAFPHFKFRPEDLTRHKRIPVLFSRGTWKKI